LSGIRAALFDLGNVLVNFDHRRAASRIAPYTAYSADEIYRLFFDSEVVGLFEEGKLSERDFFVRVRDTLGAAMTFEQFVPIWNDIFFMTHQNRCLVGIVASLRSRYALGLLSNINSLHFEYLQTHFPVFGAFHRLYLSYQMDARKPAPAVYRKALQEFGVKPGECFYTDDREDLVLSARSLGIKGYVYRGIEQLKKDLQSEGIDTAGI
jgi:putative hydrolase of the HAD superfamily